MPKKLFIRTFGCQMNEYDSDKMADVLNAAEGIVKTDNPEEADIILFNTCSVREKAQEKVFHDLGRVRHLKQKNPDLVIGVGGCVASQEGDAIVARAPYVDVVFGPQTLHRLPQLIAERKAKGKAAGRRLLPGDREVRRHARRPRSRAPAPLSRSWKAAPSSAPSASSLTPAAAKCRGRSPTSSPKSPTSPRMASGKSPCSARTSTPTAATWKARMKRPTSRC